MINFDTFPKIDAHFHATTFDKVYFEIAKKYGVRFININTDAGIFPEMAEQENVALRYISDHPAVFSYIASFSMDGWEKKGWMQKIKEGIEKSINNGAVGVKIWKNIGMEVIKSDEGTYLLIDDLFFCPLFEFLSDNKIPVLAHLGEPRNCWLPLEEMTSNRNRQYYAKYPEYHAYLHPEIPDYNKQIEARDHVLKRYPALCFVGAHLGNIEWSYKELADRFDKYPNFTVDLSSRIGHLQIQSAKDYDAIRNFFIQYSDRIIYGTDAYNNPEKLQTSLVNEWHYLATYKDCETTEVDGHFKGLNLPEEALYKLYYANALKIYNRLKFV